MEHSSSLQPQQQSVRSYKQPQAKPHTLMSNKTNWEWMGKLTGHDCGLCHAVLFASVMHQGAS